MAKCYNKPYLAHPLGEKRQWYLKVAVGGSLMLFVLTLIAGPMLLFSTINPINQPNPVKTAVLDTYIEIKDN